MRLLAVDPSSTCTGYAVMESAAMIIDGGIIRPDHAGEPVHWRASEMALHLDSMVREYACDQVLIELPDGKVHRRIAGAGHGAGLSLYGLAAGIIYATLAQAVRSRDGMRLHVVTPAQWTGRVPKARRAAALRLRFPELDLSADRGLDMADAIGLGLWFFGRGQFVPGQRKRRRSSRRMRRI